MSRHLVLDGYNLIHRARGGFQKGEWPIAFNFFRGLRPIIEKFLPLESAWMAFEGHPQRQLKLLPEYKANRPESNDDFRRQATRIMDVLRHMPIKMVRHPSREADDTIASIVSHLASIDGQADITIVSSDSDFTQLLQLDQRVRLWNWRDQAFVQPPDYDYVGWKALRGDPTDNIPRCHGMTEAAALRTIKDANGLKALMQDAAFQEAFERNLGLIRLEAFSSAELLSAMISHGTSSWEIVRSMLDDMGFKSMLKPTTWDKYTSTFDSIGN